MNRYERYVASLGFIDPKVGETTAPAKELVGLKFTDYDPVATKKALGRCKHHIPNLFFYPLSKSTAIRVDTKRNIILLANSVRAVRALAKTVNI